MNYDVFLSHNSKDKPAVETIARKLKEKGLECWLDKWILVPGEDWQEALEEALDDCRTVAVFVGPHKISPWENEEMRSAIEHRVQDKSRHVIPVLLPGAPDEKFLELPRFLKRLTWVDFRNGLDDEEAFNRLVAGIKGIAPGAPISEIKGNVSNTSLGEEALNQRNKTKLLEKVEAFWVKRVLEGSIQRTKLFELDLKYKSDSVEHPFDNVQHSEPAPLPSDKNIIDYFNAAEGKLLILGEPGSGKTTILLELARDLIDRFRHDLITRIPVVFNLSSWIEGENPMDSWLVDELSDKYQIPRKIGREWVDNDQLLLLLDGLDEVRLPENPQEKGQNPQENCIDAINQFRKEHDEVEVVVCCRKEDYDTISQSKKLRLDDAVLLQPLTSEQVNDILLNTGESFSRLHNLLKKNQGWQDFANSPLVLHLMVNTYEDKFDSSVPVEEKLDDPVLEFNSVEDGRRRLLKAYVDHMFKHRGLGESFTRQQTLDWLCWLAKKMSQHGQGLFLIEKIQPEWLPSDQRKLYSIGIRLFVGLLVGSIFGLATGVSAGLIFGSELGMISGIAFGIAWGLAGWLTFERAFSWGGTLVVAIAFGLAFGVPGWLALGALAAFAFGSLGLLAGGMAFRIGSNQLHNIKSVGTPENIVIVEALKWSWGKARKSLMLWIFFGLLVGLGIGTPVWLAAGPRAGWTYGIATTFVYVVTFGIAGGLTSGEIETKTIANQGIRRSKRNGDLIGGAFGVTIALIFGISFGFTFGLINGLVASIAAGLAGWVVGWLLFGGLTYIQHYCLRLILFYKNYAPWNYSKFLDYASERIFLRKVGGGYIFIHRFLLDYFAQICE